MARTGFFRTMATLTRRFVQATDVPKTPAVTVSYSSLLDSPSTLTKSIEKAFGSGPDSLGIIIVNELPPAYAEYRARLLQLAYKFAHLDENIREKYADPKSKYSFGWSHGKEIMNGRPDLLKGSYYANPTVDKPNVSPRHIKDFCEYYSNNIWPTGELGVEGFEEAFKNLGGFVYKVGLQLALACQPFASSYLTDSSVSLPDLISKSQTTKARLLHYFPPPDNSAPAADEPIDSWCGFHLDHSLITGLCSAMYLKEVPGSAPVVVPSPSEETGLYIRTRGGDLTKVTIPPDCLAFQTGEALELATAGKLRATPHCVRVGSAKTGDIISRETFALFMQPDTDQPISASQTFGQFSKKVFDEHYGETASM